MNIGEKIAKARKENNLTQAELGSRLCVTFQAVSKWERGESSPDFETICAMSKIFGVPITYFSDVDKEEAPSGEGETVATIDGATEAAIKTEETNKEATEICVKPILALCEKCNKPIYDSNDIIRFDKGRIKCVACDKREKEEVFNAAKNSGLKRRKFSFIFSPILSVVCFILIFSFKIASPFTVVMSLLAFSFLSCVILDNNFIGDTFCDLISFFCIRFPGLIFTFDIDGIIWALCVKALFFCINVILSILSIIVAILVGFGLSAFVYPFAIKKNLRSPEVGNYSTFK